MQYFLTFLEGIISFISPCMLPMLPVYISYFGAKNNSKHKVFSRALFFVAGFTLVFALLGLFAGTLGYMLNQYKNVINIVCGIIVVIFGLSYLEVFNLPFFKGMKSSFGVNGIFSAFLFGMIYSVNLTPCVGVFLGSALTIASVSANAVNGVLLLVAYSLGLGIPFVFSAVLLNELTVIFNFIKKHYKVINLVCGIFLVLIGILMIFGIFDKFISLFA